MWMNVLVLGGKAESLIEFRGPLIRELVNAGHKVIAAAPDFNERIEAAVRALGGQPLEVPLARTAMNPIRDAQSIWTLIELMKQIKPDVLIAYTAKPVIYGSFAARLAGVPSVTALITGLGYAFVEGNEAKRWLARYMLSILYRLTLSRCQCVLFQNPDDRQTFLDLGIISKRTPAQVVNGSGVDTDFYSLTPVPDKTRFLMITRLLGDKGVREYAQAARILRARSPKAEVALAGYLDISPNSIKPAELAGWQAEGLEFLGTADDVRPAIARSTVVVLPSYREGTPRVVLEAMAMGRAIITSDAPGCRETVKHGLNGLLVPPRDAETLAAAMLELASDPDLVRSMGKASRQIAVERYEASKVARDVLRYAGLLP
jgi:glycosyltransferase involved in cell wall biosynthesis